tara:strand:+ start:185 stop:334 length:150 start_codon:yes stop_codon:yes gene_type:complete
MAAQETQTDLPQVVETHPTVMPTSKTLTKTKQQSAASPMKMSVVNVTKQ